MVDAICARRAGFACFAVSLAVNLLWPMLAAVCCVGCRPSTEGCGEQSTRVEPTNLLVVILDDVGVDQLAIYGARDAAPTPTIDCLCARGLRFDRVWSAPLCTPGRAALMTGRQADRTGLGYNIGRERELPLAERTIGEVLGDVGMRTALMGKWHLSGWSSEQGVRGPLLQGFSSFRGTLANLDVAAERGERVGDYRGFWQVIDGDVHWTSRYATTVTVDDALDFIDGADGPWALVLSLHAPHEPLDRPPRRLLSQPLARDATLEQRYRALLEAADSEIGRLVRALPEELREETLIVVTSDNGTSPEGSPYERDERVKRTLFEGGIHVPLLFAGPPAPAGRSSAALVHLVDLLPTFAEIFGAPAPAELDGVSLVPLLHDPDTPGPRYVQTLWTPGFTKVERAVRDSRYKLIEAADGEMLFDLLRDPDEQDNLLVMLPLDPDVSAAWSSLSAFAAGGIPR